MAMTVNSLSVAMWVFLAFAVERLVEIVVKAIPPLHRLRIMGIEVPFLLAFVFSLLGCWGRPGFLRRLQHPVTLPVVGYVFSALVMTGGST